MNTDGTETVATNVDTSAEAGFLVVVVACLLVGLAAGFAAYLDVKDTADALCGDFADCDPSASTSFRALFDGSAPWVVASVVAGVGRYIAAAHRRS
jgi:hypothetical protein